MKKIFIITILLFLISLFSTEINIKVNIDSFERSNDLRSKLRVYQKDLESALNQFDWNLFDIEDYNSITVQLKIRVNSSKDEQFNGSIDIVGGVDAPKGTFQSVRFKKDIKFQETESKFYIDETFTPNLSIDNYERLEKISQYYIYLALLESYDRLSYVDKPDFILLGDRFKNKLELYISSVKENLKQGSWQKRLRFFQKYFDEKSIEIRRLNALIFNARDLYNKGSKYRKRVSYYLPHIIEKLESIPTKDRNKFFSNYYFDFGELFSFEKEKGYIDKLIELDKAHKGHYERKR
ncbi:MAG: hypothetical protein CR982_10735 [Candidatus Cloacimonadota bacterium]|nr:MAG: hypothetical protein CR982_10735 [Candidatus Cloacimonadota bacterium]PIE78580.1 MAG: hypothetical protein CSA15_06775 [Candidatus Delongbacteria bacterium]